MNNSCICAPIHLPKFNFGKKFIESYNKYFDDDHIFLIFSNQKECDVFKLKNPTLKYRSIIFDGPEYNGDYIDNPTVTLKKWHGLNEIYKTTDIKYVGVVDVDCCFIEKKNYSKLFNNYYANKILHGHFTKHIHRIHEASKALFNENQRNIIDEKVRKQDSIFYFWFNNIPIYERNDFLEFKNIINNNINIATWNTFDYVAYGYYLLLTDKFKLYNFDSARERFSILEDSDNDSFLERIQPMWLRKKYVTTNSIILKNVFMQFHVDR